MVPTYFIGLSTSLSLIVAIGAQNAFVLRQGLLKEHVFAVCLFCALSDAALILLGVYGMAGLSELAPWLLSALRWGGAAFLIAYGARAFLSAWSGSGALVTHDAARKTRSLGAVLTTAAALTWLNPHVYLDTVGLLGAVSLSYPPQWAFALGAISGSVFFFFALGYGARLLAPVFARPFAWRVLDVGIGVIMWAIALSLILYG